MRTFFRRVEQSSPSPNSYNIPQKTQIQQNKNYYNTSNGSNNYNSYSDPYYTIYDDEIYGDVGEANDFIITLVLHKLTDFYLADYSNQFNNQQKATQSSTYRPSTTQTPKTFAPKPQTQSTTYLTQTQPPKTYNQQIYDYDEALVAQVSKLNG